MSPADDSSTVRPRTVTLWDDELERYREEVRSILEHLPDLGEKPGAADLDMMARAASMRDDFAAAIPASNDTEPPASLEAITVPGPGGEIPVRLFRPSGAARGLYLHLHGGGWILGSAAQGDVTNAALAEQHGLVVASVEYRLAPEHPYPAGPDDCETVGRWLLELGRAELGTERLLIGGESAGAHLGLVTALRMRDRAGEDAALGGLNLVFGIYDLQLTPSARRDGQIDMLSASGLSFMADCFAQGLSADVRRGPDVSPLYADLRGLPPTLVTVGANDHLVDDSLFLAGRLAMAGVDTELQVYPDCPHGFMALPTKMTAAWAARTADWFSRTLEG